MKALKGSKRASKTALIFDIFSSREEIFPQQSENDVPNKTLDSINPNAVA